MNFSRIIVDALNRMFSGNGSILNVGFNLGSLLSELTYYSINNQVGTTYQLKETDVNKLVTLDNALPITVTVPNNGTEGMEIGSHIELVQKGIGKVTFAEGLGVTIKSKNGNKTVNGQNVAVSLIKEDVDTWYLFGDLTA